jgi:putative cardiolipin synthase
MIDVLVVVAIGLALFAGAATLTVWSAGRFAKRKRGAPSEALPPGDDTALDALLAPLEAAHPGQSAAAHLPDGPEALRLRLATAQLASRSLDLLYYIWQDDLTGRLLARAILDAADRGARVRLLLDDVNVLNHDPVYRALDRHRRIEVRLFNPIRTRDRGFRRGLEILLTLLPYNRRMHSKLWLADGRLGVTGGRNIGDVYFGAEAGPDPNYEDLDTLLAGPILREAEALFDRYWNAGVALPIRTLWPGKKTRLSRFRSRLARYFRAPRVRARLVPLALHEPEAATPALRLDSLCWTSGLSFLGDPPEKALGAYRDGWMPASLLPVLRGAQTTLRIMTPYFVPGPAGLAELLALQRAGVQVELITNGLALSDNVFVHGAYRWYRARLLRAGVRIHEVAAQSAPRRMLHAKAFLVDGRQGFVGSFNFDLRSAFLNTELGVLFDDPALVHGLGAIMDAATRPDAAFAVTLDGKLSQWSRGGQGATHLEPESNALKRSVSFVIGHLPIHRFL